MWWDPGVPIWTKHFIASCAVYRWVSPFKLYGLVNTSSISMKRVSTWYEYLISLYIISLSLYMHELGSTQHFYHVICPSQNLRMPTGAPGLCRGWVWPQRWFDKRIQIASYSLVSNMAGKLPNLDQPCLSTFFCDLILTKCQFTKD